MSKPIGTVCVLLYGKYPRLHRECLQSVVNSIPADIPIRVGLNNVCDLMLKWLEEGRLSPQLLVPGTLKAGNLKRGIEQGRITYYSSGNQNIKKYPMMRRMFWEDKLQSDWVIWVDDDVHIDEGSEWWQLFTEMADDPETNYMGEPWLWEWRGNQQEFIKTRPWYKGLPPQSLKGKPGVSFHTGGFVMARTKLLKKLDWPDQKLVHNGGDTLLSEAVRQNGGHITSFPTKMYGVHVNSAKRRGYSEPPLGTQ